jgi:DNA invertase Pin-like site-specific DNA recombinase
LLAASSSATSFLKSSFTPNRDIEFWQPPWIAPRRAEAIYFNMDQQAFHIYLGQYLAADRDEGNGIDPGSCRWYLDKGKTGDNLQRPDFARLQRDIFAGQIRTVVVYKLDRLSRNLRDGINVLSDWCDRGLRVVSVTQQIDFSGPVGRMIAAVLLGVAQMEQETRRERQAAGIAVAKRAGKYQRRRPGTTKAQPNRAWALRQNGNTVTEIARALGVSRPTIFKYLRACPAARA